MKIEAFLEKKERLQVRLLQKLIAADGQMSYADLRIVLGISRKSLDTYIEDINDYCQRYDGACRLELTEQTLSLVLASDFSITTVYTDYVKESLKYQIVDYFFQQREFTIVKITNDLLISESSLFRKIKEINEFLKEFELQIKNSQLQGEELQIRYFYFQLYSLVIPHEILAKELTYAPIKRLLSALEKELEISISPYNRVRLGLWLNLGRKRVAEPDKQFKKVKQRIKPYAEDSFYLRVRQLVLLYLSRFSVEAGEEESILLFIFLTTMSIMDETDFYFYDLVRSRRVPTALSDTLLRETVLFYYRPHKPSISLEKKLNYYLSQINGMLYFYRGSLELYERDQRSRSESSLLGGNVQKISQELLALALINFKQSPDKHNTLQQMTAIEYAHVLLIIDYNLSQNVTVALDLALIEVDRERVGQMLSLSLKSVIGIEVATFQPKTDYDLIITNRDPRTKDYHPAQVYRLSNDYSSYDIQQIKQEIEKLRENLS